MKCSLRTILLSWMPLATFLVLSACGSKKIPRFDRPIYALDHEGQILRYRGNVDMIPLSDPRVDGAVVFLGDDFARFTEVYISGCLEWDPSLPMVDALKAVKEARGH